MIRHIFLSILLVVFVSGLQAQDTLPKFSVRLAGNGRVVIGWVNPHRNTTQISIQRSHDSLKNYKTILSVADPNAIQNGFMDTKAPNDHMYYRLFYVLEGGLFYFTKAMRPDSSKAFTLANGKPVIPGMNPERSLDSLHVKPVIKKPDFVPSLHVFTNKEGYVQINLPDATLQKYRIKFFEEDNTPLFELKTIPEKLLTLDKANFMHSGWFFFELYNEDQLVERHKFFLPKAF